MSYNKLIYSILCNTSFDNGKITKYDNAKHDYEDDENDDVNDGDGGNAYDYDVDILFLE